MAFKRDSYRIKSKEKKQRIYTQNKAIKIRSDRLQVAKVQYCYRNIGKRIDLIAPIIFSCFECTNIIYVALITLKSDQSRVRCHC